MRRAIGFAGAPNEDIEELFAVAVNERGDRATLNDIYASSSQCEVVVREIADRKNEFDFAVKPRPNRFRIARIHVG